MGEIYLYADKTAQLPNFCNLVPNSECNAVYGWSIGRGAWTFPPGKWTKVRQTVRVNTFSGGKPNADGVVTVWVNDNPKPVLYLDKIVYRTQPNTKLLGIDFETFFGGSKPAFLNTKDQYAYYKNFKLAAY
jgi:hypothetical protein